jgi:hypothetical protein
MRYSCLVAILFVALISGCGTKKCSKKKLSVEIYNSAIYNAVSIIIYSSDSDKPIMAGNLPIHESKSKCIPCDGECTFSIEVVFEKGDTIKSIEHYSEGGYKHSVIIDRDAIKVETSSDSY